MFAICLVLYFSHQAGGLFVATFLVVPEHEGCDMNNPYNFDFAISCCAVLEGTFD